jgi:hypothetical protein
MTQAEKKLLATQIVGDGQSPNKFFVTTSPYVTIVDELGERDSEMLEGFTNDDIWTEVFDTYEEAKEHFDRIELDHYHGICQIMLEDRLTGVIKETGLEKMVTVRYTQVGYDDSKRFGYEKK